MKKLLFLTMILSFTTLSVMGKQVKTENCGALASGELSEEEAASAKEKEKQEVSQ